MVGVVLVGCDERVPNTLSPLSPTGRPPNGAVQLFQWLEGCPKTLDSRSGGLISFCGERHWGLLRCPIRMRKQRPPQLPLLSLRLDGPTRGAVQLFTRCLTRCREAAWAAIFSRERLRLWSDSVALRGRQKLQELVNRRDTSFGPVAPTRPLGIPFRVQPTSRPEMSRGSPIGLPASGFWSAVDTDQA